MNNINYKLLNRLMAFTLFLVIILIFNYINILQNIRNVVFSLFPFYLAFFLTWIMQPLVHFFMNKFKFSKKNANILALFINILIVGSIIFVIFPLLIIQFWDLAQNSTEIVDSIEKNVAIVTDFFNSNGINPISQLLNKAYSIIASESPIDLIQQIDFDKITSALGSIFGIFKNVISVIIQIIFAYIIAFYLSNDFDSFVDRTLELFFYRSRDRNRIIFIEVTSALFGYFKGLFLVCFFIGSFVTIGTALLGIQSPLLFGLIAGLFNVIPYLGPILGGIPLFLVALSYNLQTVLLSLIVIFGAQFIESNFLQPKVMAKSTNIHPVTVMVGLILFQQLFGFFGMFISTPTLAMIAVLIKHSNLNIRI